MQLRVLPLVFVLCAACSNESAPPHAAGALGGVPKTYTTPETPPVAEKTPAAAETAPAKRTDTLRSSVIKKKADTENAVLGKL